MVGVPALTVWPSGTSSWIGWPTLRAISRSISSLGAEDGDATGEARGDEEGYHRPDPRRARRASRATARSSKLDGAVPHDLDGLVALAGDHDDVARRASSHGQGDGGRPVGLDGHGGVGGHAGADRLDDGERVLAPRVVGGQDHPIGEAGRHLAHLRPLAGGRGRRRRRPPRSPARRPRPRGPRRARRRGRRACGRSRRARRTAGPRRPARTARARAAPRPGPAAMVAVGMPSRAAAVAAASALLTLKRPPSGSSTAAPRQRNVHGVAPDHEVVGVGERVARRWAPVPAAGQLDAARVVEVHDRGVACSPAVNSAALASK